MATLTAQLTIEQFLQLPEEQTQRCELVEGEIVPMPNAGRQHEWVKGNFIRHLVAYQAAEKANLRSRSLSFKAPF